MFEEKKVTKELLEWLKNWFMENGKDCNAVIGISGGKDSTVTAALCVEALGKDRVIGVMMPNGTQADISDSIRVCEFLGIRNYTVNIKDAVDALLNTIKFLSCNALASFNNLTLFLFINSNSKSKLC